jgi:protein-ribulosamine 3-kinase
MTEFACHHSAILSDGSYSVFAKFSEAANGLEQFEIELAGLRLLSERSGVLTPTPIGIVPVAGGSILVLEVVQAVDRAPRHWRQIGQTLARIHKIKGDRFGLETHGYFGPLYQDNTPMNDWPTFYAERRLWPGLRLAIDSENIPPVVARQVEKLISRLPELCGPEIVPSLLHGDAQQNNFISTEMGAVVIDPAVYYGNPEVDLACVDYFQAVPDDVFDGYQDELPIDPGFRERRDLWRVWGYLAAVTVEGPVHLGKLTEAVQKYV